MDNGMGFTRELPLKLISQLNELEADPKSWWNSLLRKKNTFFAVRPGYLSVYTCGGLLLRIELGNKGRLSCKVHEEYLFLSSTRPYVNLNKDSEHIFNFITSLQGLVQDKNYQSVQNRIKKYQGEERQGVGLIASKIHSVLDIEVTAEQPTGRAVSSSVQESGRGSIDLLAVDSKGILWFFEAKLLRNPELRAKNSKPAVIKQIDRYEEWLDKNERKIVDAYNNVLSSYSKLKGSFFQKRRETTKVIKGIRKRPVLLVYGFTEPQRKGKLPPLREELLKHGLSTDDILTIGNAGNLTKKRLFSP